MSNNIDLSQIYKHNFYPAPEKLYLLAKKENPDIKRKEVKEFMNNQEAEQLTKERKERRKQGHIISLLPNEIWQMDIYVLDRYEKQNRGYAYILAIVDVFTRKAYAEPMKNKDIKTVCETFQKIINESGVKPRSIICDNDGAFTGELFQELCIKLKIALQPSIVSDHKSLGIIDNFARRIKRTLTKIFLNTKSTVWYSQLPRIINLYNESPHSSIDDLTPEEAGAPKNFENIFEINSSKSIANEKFTDLNIGDKVRLDIRTQFTKGTDQAYSDKVYKVIKVDNRNITLDNEKSYKRSSLVKVPDSAKDTNISQPVQKAIKAKRVKTVLAREGLEAANIIKNKRNRPVVNYA